MRGNSAAILVAIVVLAGCSKKAAEVATVVDASPAVSAAPVADVPSAAPSSSQPGGIAATLAQRLQSEAQNRPHIQPNADDVLAAFSKLGGTVSTKKQGLGATYKASFCEGGTTDDGAVTMSVCEYADDDSARAGLAALQAIYPARQASHVLHKDTVLTTLRLRDDPPARSLESKLVAAYKVL